MPQGLSPVFQLLFSLYIKLYGQGLQVPTAVKTIIPLYNGKKSCALGCINYKGDLYCHIGLSQGSRKNVSHLSP